MRTPSSAPPVVAPRPSDLIIETRRYKVITPLFGGGVMPGEADPITVVRASEVRGHLRFWWRATRGGQSDGSLEQMRRSEETIWGSPGAKGKPGPSPVTTEVQVVQRGQDVRSVEGVAIGEPSSRYSYVAFPLRAEPGKPGGKVVQGVEFLLTLRFPAEHCSEIAAAVWAWETFGGIGARTRRGFGALQCIEINHQVIAPPAVESVREIIEQGLQTHVTPGKWPRNVPHLIREFRLTPAGGSPDPMRAWVDLFGKMKRFRQARFSNARGQPYGRSKWPEPDAIRRITGKSALSHARPRLEIDKFPRARFGLPIIFQFKDANLQPGDPQPTTLQGLDHDRLASPLILRPLACAGGRAIGLAAILEAPTKPPGGWILKGAPGDPQVEAQLGPDEAAAIEPLAPPRGSADVLRAFLNSL